MAKFVSRTIDSLSSGPLGPVVGAVSAHPRITAWLVLSLGMVILLVVEARDVGLLLGQWAALVGATVLVSGACVWIVSWEDEDEVTAEALSESENEG